jgi:hypothetical protein
VNVRTDLGASDLFLISEDLLFKRLFEFNVMRLCCATSIAELLWTRISGLAVRANPFEFYVAKAFLGH